MSKTMDAQQEGQFDEMNERDREIQASIWALLFLVSELSLAVRTMHDVLLNRGSLLNEDTATIEQLSTDEERVRVSYEYVEQSFREKFERVMTAMNDPEAVAKHIAERATATRTIDLTDLPKPPGSTGEVSSEGDD